MHLLLPVFIWPSRTAVVQPMYIVEQVRALLERGTQVEVIVARASWERDPGYLEPAELELDPQRMRLTRLVVPRLPEFLSRSALGIQLNARLAGFVMHQNLRDRARSFDGVIVHGERNFGLSAPLWLPALKVPAVLIIHGRDPALEACGSHPTVHAMTRQVCEVMRTVALVGESLRPYAESVGYLPASIRVVSNGGRVPPADEVLYDQRPVWAARTVLSVSRLIEWKGIDLNLKALALVTKRRPEIHFRYRVVGDGPEMLPLKRLAAELGLSGKVKFIGALPHAEALDAIADSDVFCLPSWKEAFGLVYLEAMGLGRPTVGCYENGASEIITHDVDGMLVEPKNVHDLADVLETLLADPQRCAQLGRAGRCRAEAFTWEANAVRTLETIGLA